MVYDRSRLQSESLGRVWTPIHRRERSPFLSTGDLMHTVVPDIFKMQWRLDKLPCKFRITLLNKRVLQLVRNEWHFSDHVAIKNPL